MCDSIPNVYAECTNPEHTKYNIISTCIIIGQNFSKLVRLVRRGPDLT